MDVPGRKPIPTRCVRATPDELKMVKDAGATISIATTSDLRVGFGLPPVSDFLAAVHGD